MKYFKDILLQPEFKNEKKEIELFRAYLVKDGDEIKFPTDGELLYFDRISAIENLINRETAEWKGQIIAVISFTFSIKENIDLELGTDHLNPETKSVGVALCKLRIKNIKIDDLKITEIETEMEPQTEIKHIIKIETEKNGIPLEL